MKRPPWQNLKIQILISLLKISKHKLKSKRLFQRLLKMILNLFKFHHEIRLCHRSKTKLQDRKSTRLNSSHVSISYAVFCLKKKNMDQSIYSISIYTYQPLSTSTQL